MIERMLTKQIERLAATFPAVMIVGARQCGKTTLAKHFVSGSYFDLERPSDYAVFEPDAELALTRLPEPLILDEAQRMPGLFSLLRSVIDENRDRKGRFFLLGSVSPELVRAASESLAGRIGTAELSPFNYIELASQGIDFSDFWLRGGFPDSILAPSTDTSMLWLEQYVQALVGRDFMSMGVSASPYDMTRFLVMVANMHGGLLNASSLGKSLGVTYHTVNRYLDIAEGHFILRRLHPWHSNIGKRLVKSPKVYIRDSGIFHSLVGARSQNELLVSPKRGASWEGMMIEQIITLERVQRPGSRFWFYRTATGTEIDLVVDRGSERIGFEFKAALSASKGDISGLLSGIADGVISSGTVVHAGTHAHPLAEGVESKPAEALLFELAQGAS
jgi:predicted AAA+ superfamily ATPase